MNNSEGDGSNCGSNARSTLTCAQQTHKLLFQFDGFSLVELKVAKRTRRPTASQGSGVSQTSVDSPGPTIRTNTALTGRTAFVTGAFGGLGRHFAVTLARAGAKVALAGRRIAEGERLAEQITKDGGQATVVALDV